MMPSSDIREVLESPQWQGSREKIAWSFDFTAWNVGGLSNPVVLVEDITPTAAPSDVTSAVLAAGSPTINGQVVTTPLVQNLTPGHTYRVSCRAQTSGGGERELWLRLLCDF